MSEGAAEREDAAPVSGAGAGPAEEAAFRRGKRLDRPQPGVFGELRYRLYQASWYFARAMFYVLFGLRLRGRENVPAEGGFLVASNHQSFLDPIIIGLVVGPRRQIHYMARRTLFSPALGWLIRLYNAFPIERSKADFKALTAAQQRLEAGIPVLVFPEGTRTPDGRLQKVRSGAARLALSGGVPVLPCYIHGAHRAWGKGKKFLRPIRGMRVTLGEAIMPEGAADSRSARNELTEKLRKALAALEEEAYSNEVSPSGGTRSE
ncbi:MAG: 1-acyl-sn-glycerol-3-phosphate acyltransferase [Planctomycetes bacterium]|nr:1-acyl-sn-glycerol-3-phosphate acyltransferase [Planctomycetota bacterium]